MSQLSQYNDASIITWNGIITMYGVIKNMPCTLKPVQRATEDEVRRYNEKR